MASKQVNQAEVWEAPVPYPDKVQVTKKVFKKTLVSFQGDVRPVVVVSNNSFNSSDYVLACPVTTRINKIARYYPLDKYVVILNNNYQVAGFDYPSAILSFKLSIIHQDQLKYKRGVLPQGVTPTLLRYVQGFF